MYGLGWAGLGRAGLEWNSQPTRRLGTKKYEKILTRKEPVRHYRDASNPSPIQYRSQRPVYVLYDKMNSIRA